MSYHLGIDPGVKNCGFAVLSKEGDEVSVVGTLKLDSSKSTDVIEFATFLIDEATLFGERELASITIERFVPFGSSTATAIIEDVNLMIGAVCAILQERKLPKPKLVRSVEWKTNLVKSLVRSKGFSNPSQSLDKQFSFAAAKAVLDIPYTEKITDHEADAICLAAYPIYNLYK